MITKAGNLSGQRCASLTAEGLLPRASADELDRLVGVAMAVIQEEAKGR